MGGGRRVGESYFSLLYHHRAERKGETLFETGEKKKEEKKGNAGIDR